MNTIQLNRSQIIILREVGKPYNGLSFSNLHISSTGGALCEWVDGSKYYLKLTEAIECYAELLEIDREDLKTYIKWFDNQEKDAQSMRQQTGHYKPRTQVEKDLYTYLKLTQAFIFSADIREEE